MHTFRNRTRTVRVNDDGLSVTIRIDVGVRNAALTRDEHARVLDSAASRAMKLLTKLPHTTGFLSRVKVTK